MWVLRYLKSVTNSADCCSSKSAQTRLSVLLILLKIVQVGGFAGGLNVTGFGASGRRHRTFADRMARQKKIKIAAHDQMRSKSDLWIGAPAVDQKIVEDLKGKASLGARALINGGGNVSRAQFVDQFRKEVSGNDGVVMMVSWPRRPASRAAAMTGTEASVVT